MLWVPQPLECFGSSVPFDRSLINFGYRADLPLKFAGQQSNLLLKPYRTGKTVRLGKLCKWIVLNERKLEGVCDSKGLGSF